MKNPDEKITNLDEVEREKYNPNLTTKMILQRIIIVDGKTFERRLGKRTRQSHLLDRARLVESTQ